MTSTLPDRPEGVHILAGVLPFLIFGLSFLLWDSLNGSPEGWGWLALGLLVASYLLVVGLGLALAWMRGFPRWAFPYAGGSLSLAVIIFYAANRLGWLAQMVLVWIPLWGAATLAVYRSGLRRPWKSLLTGAWLDETRLSFGLYGFLPLLAYLLYNDIAAPIQAPLYVVSILALAGGALGYMVSRQRRSRILALMGGWAVFWITATLGISMYWNGRQGDWMAQPAPPALQIALNMGMAGLLVAGLIFAPLILSGLMHSEDL